MKKTFLLFVLLALAGTAGSQVRKEIAIPDLKGYKTLKCDFHIHTVFSDGTVWPTVRVDEAYNEGLDAIAITDHIEVRPWRGDVPGSHNRSYEIAAPRARDRDIILIKGTEITKHVMPPGHFNALYLPDAEPLDTPEYLDAMKAAKDQGAFLLWNHPGWRAQQDSTVWWPEHTEIYDKGYMQGIEVYNSDEYYPEAHQWALDRKLTIFANTDVHSPIGMSYDLANGHRPMTLVFARERTAESIREALEARRTAAYFDDIVVAEERYLKELFENAVSVIDIRRNGNKVALVLQNNSDIPFHIKKAEGNRDNIGFRDFTIPAMKRISVTATLPDGFSGNRVYIEVSNLYAKPDKGLEYVFSF